MPAGIELATFRFVAQHLNYCATAVGYVYKLNELMKCTLMEKETKTTETKTFRHSCS